MISIKNSLASSLNHLETLVLSPKPGISVLCYHSISNDHTIDDIVPEEFWKQIEYLRKTHKFVSLDEVTLYLEGKMHLSKPTVAITFDDGYSDLLSNVAPSFAKMNIPAAVFVLSKPEKANRIELENEKPLLSFAQMKKLQKLGWTIGCHTATHPNLTNAGVNVKAEITDSKKQLERALHTPVHYFAYPKGIFTSRTVEAVKKAGFRAAFIFTPHSTTARTNQFMIPRIGVDSTHSIEQFRAFFTRWGSTYISLKHKISQQSGNYEEQ
jgi:peptidoglycan/xylan/chitin deacetylase (PgdA/CDA1 family)